jgi:Predicted integral membrane protein linked to a cation pump
MSEAKKPNAPTERSKGLSDGKRVMIALLAFFGLVFTVDGIFIYLAATTKDGLVETNYYQKGLHYDDVVQLKKRQAELGWSFDLTPPAKNGPLEIHLKDAQGKPLSGMRIAASLRRPAEAGFDQDLTLTEVAPGTYRAELTLPVSGLWDLKAQVRTAESGEKDQAIFESRFTVSG